MNPAAMPVRAKPTAVLSEDPPARQSCSATRHACPPRRRCRAARGWLPGDRSDCGVSSDDASNKKNRALDEGPARFICLAGMPDQPALQHGSAPHAGSAAQPGSAQQLVLAPEQQSLPRRLMRAPRARPRRRGSQQFVAVAQQAGSAAQQAGSAAAQPAEAPQDGSAAAQAGSAAQLGPQSQLVRPRRPRPAAEAESAAKKPTIRSTAPIMTIEGKRFMKLSLLRKSNRVAVCEQTAARFLAACGTTADPD